MVGDKNLAVAIPPSFEEEQQGIDQNGRNLQTRSAGGLDLDAYLGQNRRAQSHPPLLSERETSLSIEARQNSTVFPLLALKAFIERSSDEKTSFSSALPEGPEFSLANRPNRPQPKKGMKQNEDHGLTFAPTMKKQYMRFGKICLRIATFGSTLLALLACSEDSPHRFRSSASAAQVPSRSK